MTSVPCMLQCFKGYPGSSLFQHSINSHITPGRNYGLNLRENVSEDKWTSQLLEALESLLELELLHFPQRPLDFVPDANILGVISKYFDGRLWIA